MASGVRYRYRGKFISEIKAQRIANLKNASKFITTQIHTQPAKKGYIEPIEKRVVKAIKADRLAAEEKRARAAKTTAEYRRDQRERQRRAIEKHDFQEVSKRVARRAVDDDIGLDDALDQIEFPVDKMPHYTADDIIDAAGDYLDEGEGFFDFDIIDIEDDSDEDKYKNK